MPTGGEHRMTKPASDQAIGEATFDNAIEGLRATGASVDTRELVELLSHHGSEEGAILASYEELANESEDESIRYLVKLVLDDERRHHRLLAEMANAMVWGTVKATAEPATPDLSRRMDADLLAQTKQLRQFEENDARHLEQLRKRLRPYADTTLWVLLVDLMLLDTKKHTTILKFLEKHKTAR